MIFIVMLNINFGVKNEKECKKQILKIAYQEAEIRAQALAEAAGKLLKQCIRVDFRPINAEYVSFLLFSYYHGSCFHFINVEPIWY